MRRSSCVVPWVEKLWQFGCCCLPPHTRAHLKFSWKHQERTCTLMQAHNHTITRSNIIMSACAHKQNNDRLKRKIEDHWLVHSFISLCSVDFLLPSLPAMAVYYFAIWCGVMLLGAMQKITNTLTLIIPAYESDEITLSTTAHSISFSTYRHII